MSGILTRPSGLVKPTVGSVSWAAAAAARSPLAWYRLGEASGTTMVDSSGNALDGTYSGSPTLGSTSLITGDADKSVTFAAASSQYASSGGGALLVKDFAHAVWVKSVGADGSLIRDINGVSSGYLVSVSGSFINYRAGSSAFTGTVADTALNDGGRHFLVWSINGTAMKLYIDGTLMETITVAAAASRATPLTQWRLARNGNNANFININADEWAIFSSLSDADVAALYAAGV